MNLRTAVTGGLIAACAVGLFLWIASSPTGSREGPQPQPSKPGVPNGADGTSVVRANQVDPSSANMLAGVVVDTEGEPVDGGLLVLHCLARGANRSTPIPGGVVKLEADGSFEGPTCNGLVCAEFRHPSMIARDPWELRGDGPHELVATLLDRREGQVVDPEQQGIAGARITVRPVPGENLPTAVPPFATSVTTSDVDGAFAFARLERPPCDSCGEANGACQPDDLRDLPVYHALLISAQAPGFRPGQIEVDLEDTDAWKLVLELPAEPITGTVVDSQGRAYPRVNILAASEDRPTEYHRAKVGDDGRFELTELGDGPHEIRAVQDGIELVRQSGVLAGASLELVGEQAATGVDLELLVIDNQGAPIVGAHVTGGPFVGAKTGATGDLRAQAVLPGKYTLTVRTAQARQRFEVAVELGEINRRTLELDRG